MACQYIFILYKHCCILPTSFQQAQSIGPKLKLKFSINHDNVTLSPLMFTEEQMEVPGARSNTSSDLLNSSDEFVLPRYVKILVI